MKIYSIKDRVKIKIGELVVHVSPLTFKQKMDIQTEMMKFESDKDTKALMQGSYLAVKYGVKAIDGLESIDGSVYHVELENDVLKDECVEDLLNMQISTQLTTVCISLINGIPEKIINPVNGKAMEGVSIVTQKKKVKQ